LTINWRGDDGPIGAAPRGGRVQGKVRSFNDANGWGWISYQGEDVFVHFKDCDGTPKPGDSVSFEVVDDDKRNGSRKALKVVGCGGKASMERSAGTSGNYDSWGTQGSWSAKGGADAWGAQDSWQKQTGGQDSWQQQKGGHDSWHQQNRGQDAWQQQKGGQDAWQQQQNWSDPWSDPWSEPSLHNPRGTGTGYSKGRGRSRSPRW